MRDPALTRFAFDDVERNGRNNIYDGHADTPYENSFRKASVNRFVVYEKKKTSRRRERHYVMSCTDDKTRL